MAWLAAALNHERFLVLSSKVQLLCFLEGLIIHLHQVCNAKSEEL